MRVDRKKLLSVLELVKPGLANSEVIDQSSSFVFDEERVMTYNDEISISCPIKDMDITCAIPAERFHRLLTRVNKDEIELIHDKDQLEAHWGGARAGLSVEGEVKLPLEELGEVKDWKKLPDRFISGLQLCVPICSNNLSNPLLTCVHVRKDGKIESSNGYRVVQYTTAGEIPCGDKGLLIPASSAKELFKYDDVKWIAHSEGWVHFKTEDDVVFSCRVFEGEYPSAKLDSILPVDGPTLRLPRGMQEALFRAQIFSQTGLEREEEVVIHLEKGRVIVRAKDKLGWFEETMRARYKGNTIEFSVHPVFLADVLTTTRKCILGENRIKFSGEYWEHVVALWGVPEEEVQEEEEEVD